MCFFHEPNKAVRLINSTWRTFRIQSICPHDLTQTVDKSINQNTAFDSEFESNLDPFNLFTVTVTLVRESLLKPHQMECDFLLFKHFLLYSEQY